MMLAKQDYYKYTTVFAYIFQNISVIISICNASAITNSSYSGASEAELRNFVFG